MNQIYSLPLIIFSYGAGLSLTTMLAVGIFPEKRNLSLLKKAGIFFVILLLSVGGTYFNAIYFALNQIIAILFSIILLGLPAFVFCKTKAYMAFLYGLCVMLIMESVGILVSMVLFLLTGDSLLKLTGKQQMMRWIVMYTLSFLLFKLIIRIRKKVSEEKQFRIALAVLFFSTLVFIVTFFYNSIFGVLLGLDLLNSNGYITGISILFILLGGVTVFILNKSILRHQRRDRQLP